MLSSALGFGRVLFVFLCPQILLQSFACTPGPNVNCYSLRYRRVLVASSRKHDCSYSWVSMHFHYCHHQYGFCLYCIFNRGRSEDPGLRYGVACS